MSYVRFNETRPVGPPPNVRLDELARLARPRRSGPGMEPGEGRLADCSSLNRLGLAAFQLGDVILLWCHRAGMGPAL